MKPQKFKRGDLVHIAKDLGPSMSHFTSDQDAIVMGGYKDQYGGDDTNNYTLMFLNSGSTASWYYECQLTFIRHVGESGISEVESERDKRCAKESDLDWIVSNWPSIRDSPSGATMNELMRLCGITEPWGKHGEGVEWYGNAMATRRFLDPVLLTGDMKKVGAFLKWVTTPEATL